MNEQLLSAHGAASASEPAARLRALLGRLGPGVVLSAMLAVLAMGLESLPGMRSHAVGALTAAIALGVAFGNTGYRRLQHTAAAGVNFSRQTLLRAGVILYGLRVTLHDVGQVGPAAILIDVLVIASTFGIALWFGTRILRLDRVTATLVGAGSAICGAAAVMATEPVVRARAEQVTMAVSTVVIFGTLATVLYPALYAIAHGGPLHIEAGAFGVYAGSTIHEVAQVLAAARAVNEQVANTAVITKMVRVMLLAPFLLGLAAWTGGQDRSRRRIAVPWFALAFIGMVVINSLVAPSATVLRIATGVDTFLLAMAMAALGLTTHFSAVRAAGARPLLLGAVLFAWLILGGGAINLLVTAWLR